MADLTKPDDSSHDEGKAMHKKRLPTKVRIVIMYSSMHSIKYVFVQFLKKKAYFNACIRTYTSEGSFTALEMSSMTLEM